MLLASLASEKGKPAQVLFLLKSVLSKSAQFSATTNDLNNSANNMHIIAYESLYFTLRNFVSDNY